MNDQLPDNDDARALRTLRRLVTVLTLVMIVGIITITVLLAIRLNAPAPLVAPDPATLPLPADTTVVSVQRTADFISVVTDDMTLILLDANGTTVTHVIDLEMFDGLPLTLPEK